MGETKLRYRIEGTFVMEQRKGFPVIHQISTYVETNEDAKLKSNLFLSDYNHEYCHSLDFHITEHKRK